jgi:hypothetical protein
MDIDTGFAATLGGGFFIGLLIGYALKKSIKDFVSCRWVIFSRIDLSPIPGDSQNKLGQTSIRIPRCYIDAG